MEMTLHIFNPEHDIALANGMRQVTPPHAARQLRHDLGFIPALWAKTGDVVLVEDAEHAARAYQRVSQTIARLFGLDTPNVTFADDANFNNASLGDIDPWGWDYSIYSRLMNNIACDKARLPSKDYVSTVMELSHRRMAANMLPKLRTIHDTVGEAVECATLHEVYLQIARFDGNAVLKAPWSSSGRGVRFIENAMTPTTERWARNILAKQKALMVEPNYRRIADFGMEFNSRGDGTAEYLGLSLFSTIGGAYSGNILATEARKRTMLSRFVGGQQLDAVREAVCSNDFAPLTSRYKGPFGIDMMIVAGDNGNGFMLHPCVEINLRRTMGHLALSLTPGDDDVVGLMQVAFEGKFKLRIRRDGATSTQ